MATRTCECDHEFPYCVCALGYTGAQLRYQSRLASGIIGWPTLHFDPAALADHNERMRLAREPAASRDEALQPQSVQAILGRADKPRIPLGVKLGSVECGPCQEQA